MKQILLLAFILLSMFKINAQTYCGTDEYDAYLKRINPSYASDQQKMEQEIYSIIKNRQQNPNARITENNCHPSGVFTIPIVVHVIHLGEAIGTGTNISDAQIQGAIQGLNEKWRKVTGDGVDVEIQFALAKRTPDNNVSTGINRVNGSVIANYNKEGISYAGSSTGANEIAIKNLSIWNPKKYINIWVVNKIQGGWAGYADLPYYYNSSIGIVLDDTYTNKNNSSIIAHEMGHFWGLYHTFQDFKCDEGNCLISGDKICDTPPHDQNECSTMSCSTLLDLQNSIKNYMSYCHTQGIIQTRFTSGQKERMRAILFNENRYSLVTSDGLIPFNIQNEIGISKILEIKPNGTHFIPKLEIFNSGTSPITNIKINTYVDNILKTTSNMNVNIPTNGISSVPLNSLFISDGMHNFRFEIIQFNGITSDYNIINNFICDSTCVFLNPKPFLISLTYNCVDCPVGYCGNTEILNYNSNELFERNYFCNGSCVKENNITENGNIVMPTNNTYYRYTFEVCSDRNFIINSEWKKYYLGLSVYPVNSGTVNIPSGIYKCDTYFYAQATENNGYTFLYWSDSTDNRIVSWNTILPISISRRDQKYIANFQLNTYLVNVIANPLNGGTVSGGGTYNYGSNHSVSAIAKTGYKFTNWTEDSTIVSTNSNYTFLVNSARNLKANFSLVTGIKQTTINEISKIYPNPANDILQVEIRSKQNTSLTLNIIDIKGSLLETKTLTNTKGTFNTYFDVSKLSKGNYILNLYDEEGMVSYKFVVQ